MYTSVTCVLELGGLESEALTLGALESGSLGLEPWELDTAAGGPELLRKPNTNKKTGLQLEQRNWTSET